MTRRISVTSAARTARGEGSKLRHAGQAREHFVGSCSSTTLPRPNNFSYRPQLPFSRIYVPWHDWSCRDATMRSSTQESSRDLIQSREEHTSSPTRITATTPGQVTFLGPSPLSERTDWVTFRTLIPSRQANAPKFVTFW